MCPLQLSERHSFNKAKIYVIIILCIPSLFTLILEIYFKLLIAWESNQEVIIAKMYAWDLKACGLLHILVLCNDLYSLLFTVKFYFYPHKLFGKVIHKSKAIGVHAIISYQISVHCQEICAIISSHNSRED